MNRKEVEEKLINRAWQDAAFKRSLMINPKATIQREGIDLPENVEIRVVEETSDTIYLVIPKKP